MARSKFGSKRQLANGTWEVRVRSGYTRDGRPREVRETYSTEAEADAAMLALRVSMGRLPNAGDSMTLADYYNTIFVPSRSAVPRTRGDDPPLDLVPPDADHCSPHARG